VYNQAYQEFGTTNVPVSTFNKVWIVPDEAVVYENAQLNSVFVVQSSLKVMLERDYLALEKNTEKNLSFPNAFVGNPRNAQTLDPRLKHSGVTDVSNLGSQIIREIVIPALTKEVNEGKNFAGLRQVYQSLILAAWYKKNLKDNVLAKGYVDRNKTLGVDTEDKQITEKIYKQYLRAYRKGVYNYIKEEIDPATQQIIPRKYFSGGANFAMIINNLRDANPAQIGLLERGMDKAALSGRTLALTTVFLAMGLATSITGAQAASSADNLNRLFKEHPEAFFQPGTAMPNPTPAPQTQNQYPRPAAPRTAEPDLRNATNYLTNLSGYFQIHQGSNYTGTNFGPTIEELNKIQSIVKQYPNSQTAYTLSQTAHADLDYIKSISGQVSSNIVAKPTPKPLSTASSPIPTPTAAQKHMATAVTGHTAAPSITHTAAAVAPGSTVPTAVLIHTPTPPPATVAASSPAPAAPTAVTSTTVVTPAPADTYIAPRAPASAVPVAVASAVANGTGQETVASTVTQNTSVSPDQLASKYVDSIHAWVVKHYGENPDYTAAKENLNKVLTQYQNNLTASIRNKIDYELKYIDFLKGGQPSVAHGQGGAPGVGAPPPPPVQMAALTGHGVVSATDANTAPLIPNPMAQPNVQAGSTGKLLPGVLKAQPFFVIPWDTTLDPLRITSPGPGYRNNPFTGKGSEWNPGPDVHMDAGTIIYNSFNIPAEVTYAGYMNGYGYTVILSANIDGKIVTILSAHLREYYVKKGMRIPPGGKIAESGNTGRGTNAHFKLVMTIDGHEVDPFDYTDHRFANALQFGHSSIAANQAMVGASQALNPTGGIDLEKLILNTKGGGVRTAFSDPRILQMLLDAKGLFPQIQSIELMTVPMVNMLLGFNVPANDNDPVDVPAKQADSKSAFLKASLIDIRNKNSIYS